MVLVKKRMKQRRMPIAERISNYMNGWSWFIVDGIALLGSNSLV